MGLKADAQALVASKGAAARRCKAVRVGELLPEEDQEEYAEILRDWMTFTTSEVSVLLEKSGVEVSASQVAAHRGGRCICRKDTP